jgi:hypothetical protein
MVTTKKVVITHGLNPWLKGVLRGYIAIWDETTVMVDITSVEDVP